MCDSLAVVMPDGRAEVVISAIQASLSSMVVVWYSKYRVNVNSQANRQITWCDVDQHHEDSIEHYGLCEHHWIVYRQVTGDRTPFPHNLATMMLINIKPGNLAIRLAIHVYAVFAVSNHNRRREACLNCASYNLSAAIRHYYSRAVAHSKLARNILNCRCA